MRKAKFLVLCTVVLFLSGCWDEQLFRDIASIRVAGFDGEPGEIEGYYAYPVISEQSIQEYKVIKGKGKSLQEVKSDANKKMNQYLDTSQLEVILISDGMAEAEKDFYIYVDPIYRYPKYRLDGFLVIVEGNTEDYLNEDLSMVAEIPEFYSELIRSSLITSEIQNIDIQKAGTLLFDEAMDLQLPYLKIDKESGNPVLGGLALFHKRSYSGQYLEHNEAVIFNIMANQVEKYARSTFEWERKDKKYPITSNTTNLKRSWKIIEEGDSITLKAEYKMEVLIEEFALPGGVSKEMLKEIEKFLSGKYEEEFKKVFEKMQRAKSDALGIGRTVRAFHPDIWKKQDWYKTYEQMEFDVNVQVSVFSTGILK